MPEALDPLPYCVICRGPMMAVAAPPEHIAWRCIECSTTVTVPNSAWDLAAKKEVAANRGRRWTDRRPAANA